MNPSQPSPTPAAAPARSLPVSVLILTRNEEVNIAHALESVLPFSGEVFVLDSMSTDRTEAICGRYAPHGVRFFQRAFTDYADQRNYALRELPWSHPWIFWLDADESVPPALQRELIELFADGPDLPKSFYFVKRRLLFLGRWIRHASSYPTWLVRLIPREGASFDRKVNEQVTVDGDPGYLENDLLHEDRKGLAAWIERHNRYSTMEVEEYLAVRRRGRSGPRSDPGSERPDRRRGRRLERFIRLPFRPLIMFAYLYIWKRGFLDGRPGWIYCLLKAVHQVHISCKLYERRRHESGASRTP